MGHLVSRDTCFPRLGAKRAKKDEPTINPAAPGKREESIIVAGPYNEIMGIVKVISFGSQY
jgi:hypothetical protein